jgi:Tol biopolymer transport system component
MRPGVRLPWRAAALALVISLLGILPAAAQSITVLASVDNLATQLSNPSSGPSISADGRFVVFSGGVSANLGGSCTGGILLRDLAAGTTTCLASSGQNAVISGDGRFVAFQSTAIATCGPPGAGSGHAFRMELATGQIRCVSVDINGNGIIGGTSDRVSINADGRFVAFKAGAVLSVVAPGCTAGQQIFVRDLVQNVTACASVTPDGTGDNSFAGPGNFSISGDGRLVVFSSLATNHTTTPCTSGGTKVFVRNLVSNATSCVSPDGTFPLLSSDGRFVAFQANGLTASCVGSAVDSHSFVRDLDTGTITCASLAADDSPLPGNATAISSDGRFVAFTHTAFGNNPALTAMGCPLSGSNTSQVLVRDLMLATTRCVSGDQSAAGSVQSGGGVLSADGQVVAFQSDATNLVAGDLNAAADVFVNGPGITLTVQTQGAGSVTSAPLGIACGADCDQVYLRGTIVTLTATAGGGSVFASFGGDLDCGDGVVTLGASRTCTATFLPLFTLGVSRTGDGSGFVFSEPSGITCGNDCTEVLASGSVVTLGPIPIGGSVFTGFGGDVDCADGMLALAGDTTCTVGFSLLNVGTGSGGLGGGTASGESLSPSLSDDGRLVAFESTAADLSAECPTPVRQIYVLDRVAQGIRCVSRAPSGLPGTAASEGPTISGDGRVVAFSSLAPNLVAGCTVAGMQVFARQLDTFVTQCVSVGLNGVAANAPSGSPAVSRDGRWVVFESEATNLTLDCTSGVRQVFARDLLTQTTTCVSRAPGGAPGDLASGDPAPSRDGAVVVFQSSATSFAGSGCGGGLHVFAWDRATGAVTCLSRVPGGVAGNAASEAPAVSDDGMVVAFESDATNLTAECANGARQIFVLDRAAGVLRCASLTTDGVPGDAASTDAALSGDGVVVAFATGATNLMSGGAVPSAAPVAASRRGGSAQAGELAQVLRRHMGIAASVTELVSQAGGAAGNGASRRPALSQNGLVTAFQSRADNLLPGDGNGVEDIAVAEGGVLIGPPPPRPDRVRLTSPVTFSQFPLTGSTTVVFAWTPLSGISVYGFEFTGPNRVFANPNGTSPDTVNGLGGAGGGFAVAGTGFPAPLGPAFPPGTYQVRVIPLTGSLAPAGTFSDAVTLVLGTVASAIPADARVTITAPAGGSVLARGTAVTLAWTPLVGVGQYLLEATGPNGQFTQPNATTLTDPGAAARAPVIATSFSVPLPLDLPTGSYQVRVIGLSATGTPVGSFSDALTLVVQ